MEEGTSVETHETRVAMMVGGARVKTGGSRRSQVGPKPQPRWQSTVELMEVGAMVEERLTTPGG